ncbi:MAG: lipoyl(octanoyl) transferase LipB [Nitrospira sp.]|nr:lipoyl(octanoyl) transferase LipB [Nitrospira sp.]
MAGRLQSGTLLLFTTPISYADGWILQSRLHQERLLDERPDTVIILEHDPVYTLGRSTRPNDRPDDEGILRATGADVQVVNRGGSVTFHGPGQVVVYPILKTTAYAAGPKRLVWLLEEVVIRLLARRNIKGDRVAQKPGVWVFSPCLAKIASIGIRIQRGVSLHGFALNVDMDLSPFKLIRPCGLSDCRMTTMSRLGTTGLSVATVKRDLAEIFGEVFGIEWTTTVQIPDDHIGASDEISRFVPSHA